MLIYYNEWDEPTAAWLKSLGDGQHLPSGHIDTRSIRDVRPADLRGYDQCHFFAGIGGWPLALRLAGYGNMPCWTGSPPCQPFSIAGNQRGIDDERHLTPVWLDLIREFRPPVLFGEQVADAIRHGWLDDLFNALEEYGYACGAAVLPACSVGAPHIRKRLFFGAVRLADASSATSKWLTGSFFETEEREHRAGEQHGPLAIRHSDGGAIDRMAHVNVTRLEGRGGPECSGSYISRQASACNADNAPRPVQNTSFWSGADWLGCRDGKFRPVEPGTQPLAHGLPARVGRLRGYGNAIVPQVAATFIKDFIGVALKGPEA